MYFREIKCAPRTVRRTPHGTVCALRRTRKCHGVPLFNVRLGRPILASTPAVGALRASAVGSEEPEAAPDVHRASEGRRWREAVNNLPWRVRIAAAPPRESGPGEGGHCPRRLWGRANIRRWVRKGPLVNGGMKNVRDPRNSTAAEKVKVFRIWLESEGADKDPLTYPFKNSR